MKKYKGIFFAFEGIDGSGKSTIIKNICNELSNKYPIEITREPGGNIETSEKIRELLLNNKFEPETEAYLFAASRNEHVKKYIIPALKDGKIIFSDRFIDSSLAYQGFGRKLGFKNIFNLNKFGIKDFYPNYVFFFDIDLKVSESRMNNNNRKNDLFDEEAYKMKNEIYNGFKYINRRFKKNHFIIDASKSIEEVTNEVKKILLRILEEEYGK